MRKFLNYFGGTVLVIVWTVFWLLFGMIAGTGHVTFYTYVDGPPGLGVRVK
jgi:hypothetical protein